MRYGSLAWLDLFGAGFESEQYRLGFPFIVSCPGQRFVKKNYMKPTQSSIPEHPPRVVEDDGSNPNKPKPIGQSEACHLPLNTEGSQHSFIRAV